MRAFGSAVPALLLALLLAGLAGCADDPPDDTDTPTPAPATSAAPSPSTTPSPTGPVRAPDDPEWTANQLAAAHAVDAYRSVLATLRHDPKNANLGLLLGVVADPQYSIDVGETIGLAAREIHYTGTTGVIAVARSVGPEQTVDGRQEIEVRQCQADEPGNMAVENGVERPLEGSPQAEYNYVVQWQEGEQAWLVVLRTQVNPSC